MTRTVRTLCVITMTLALAFGFFHHIAPDTQFERLHIFLFNLVSGGSLILYFSEGGRCVTRRVKLFFLLALLFALAAFFKVYSVAIVCAIWIALLVERVRVQQFRFIPVDFFSTQVHTARKFHHAALLCLSMGLFMSVFAIINDAYFRLFTFEKMTLNTFFLGFSFPVSLITFAVIFSMMHRAKDTFHRMLKLVLFWVINLGVIIFFLFILFDLPRMELAISLTLFVAVCAVLYLYVRIGMVDQQKAFLTSGILFLVLTAVTGVLYIAFAFLGDPGETVRKMVLRLHAVLALYGWNLNGLAVIIRYDDFPIRLHSNKLILTHWLVALVLVPLGMYSALAAVTAVVLYAYLLTQLFFSKGLKDVPEFCRASYERYKSHQP